MKKKWLLFGFICSLSPIAYAKNQMLRSKIVVAPVLDYIDDEMTEQEAAAAAAVVPAHHSAFRHWCTAKISIVIALCMRCKRYMHALWWNANRTKKRRKRTA
jgi:hypothetical protein